jgi:antitoxin component YwqK of YwqJK toxin-antitoxin module
MNKLSVLFIILFFLSCQAKEKRRIVTEFENGKPEIIHVYKNEDDTLNYRYEKYYNSGAKHTLGNFIDNEQSGRWTWWYENGNKKDEVSFEKGYFVDTGYSWYKNGILKAKGVFSERLKGTDSCDICDGWSIEYYENGKPKSEINIKNRMYQGVAKFYDKNGGLKVCNIVDDKLEGKTIELNIDSSRLEMVFGQYKNDKEVGQWKCYDGQFRPTQIINYNNGILNGIFIKYYPNGKIKKKGFMRNGYVDGTTEYFDENGNLTRTEIVENGELKEKNDQ